MMKKKTVFLILLLLLPAAYSESSDRGAFTESSCTCKCLKVDVCTVGRAANGQAGGGDINALNACNRKCASTCGRYASYNGNCETNCNTFCTNSDKYDGSNKEECVKSCKSGCEFNKLIQDLLNMLYMIAGIIAVAIIIIHAIRFAMADDPEARDYAKKSVVVVIVSLGIMAITANVVLMFMGIGGATKPQACDEQNTQAAALSTGGNTPAAAGSASKAVGTGTATQGTGSTGQSQQGQTPAATPAVQNPSEENKPDFKQSDCDTEIKSCEDYNKRNYPVEECFNNPCKASGQCWLDKSKTCKSCKDVSCGEMEDRFCNNDPCGKCMLSGDVCTERKECSDYTGEFACIYNKYGFSPGCYWDGEKCNSCSSVRGCGDYNSWSCEDNYCGVSGGCHQFFHGACVPRSQRHAEDKNLKELNKYLCEEVKKCEDYSVGKGYSNKCDSDPCNINSGGCWRDTENKCHACSDYKTCADMADEFGCEEDMCGKGCAWNSYEGKCLDKKDYNDCSFYNTLKGTESTESVQARCVSNPYDVPGGCFWDGCPGHYGCLSCKEITKCEDYVPDQTCMSGVCDTNACKIQDGCYRPYSSNACLSAKDRKTGGWLW